MKSLHLASPEDLPKLLPLVSAFHEHQGFNTSPEHQHDAILPLLEGSPHGAIWLIGGGIMLYSLLMIIVVSSIG